MSRVMLGLGGLEEIILVTNWESRSMKVRRISSVEWVLGYLIRNFNSLQYSWTMVVWNFQVSNKRKVVRNHMS